MNSIKQGNHNTINLLQKDVAHTRRATTQATNKQQIATLLPKRNNHKRAGYNFAAVFGLIKILIDQLASPSQKEKGKTLNHAQKRGKHIIGEHSPYKTNHLTQPQTFFSQPEPQNRPQKEVSDTPQTTTLAIEPNHVDHKTHATEKPHSTQQLFEINKEKWQRSGIQNYFYTFQRSCFCTRDATREVLTHVRNGSAVMSQFKDSGQLLPQSLLLNKLSINDLFTTIEAALDKNTDVVRVQYDEETGQPTSIYIDGKTGLTDDEFSLTAKDLTLS